MQSLVKDLINPLIGLAGGMPDLSSWVVTVRSSQLNVGNFLNAILSFLLIALVVYVFVAVPVTKLMDKYKPEPKQAATKECPECLSKIPQEARRCSHCTVQIEAPSEGVAAAMRSVAPPSGEHVADEAARVLVERLQGTNGATHRSDPRR